MPIYEVHCTNFNFDPFVQMYTFFIFNVVFSEEGQNSNHYLLTYSPTFIVVNTSFNESLTITKAFFIFPSIFWKLIKYLLYKYLLYLQ